MTKPGDTNKKAKTKFHAHLAHHTTLHNIQTHNSVLVVNSTVYWIKF